MSQPADSEEIGFKSIEILKEELGTGSYGSVYRARCDDLLCAAKAIHQVLVYEPPTESPTKHGNHRIPIRRFEAEFVFLQELRHPNIIQYLGMYRDPQTKLPVILMELMDESLTDYLQSSTKSVPYHTQVNLCYDITRALSYLHVNEIVHRDLSSNNILLSGKPCRAKLSDFGMAKFLNARMSRISFTNVPGTEVYMPPESFDDQAEFKETGDVFSFGVVIVQILTRHFPKPGHRTKEIPMPNDPRFPAGTARVLVPEIERRDNHISTIEPSNPLLPLALSCLQDSSVKRPSASDLCKSLAPLIDAPEYAESKSAEESPVHENLDKCVGTSDYAESSPVSNTVDVSVGTSDYTSASRAVSTVDIGVGTTEYSESQLAEGSPTNHGEDTESLEIITGYFDQNTDEQIVQLQRALSEKDQIIEQKEETLEATKLSLQTKERVFEQLTTEIGELQQLKQTQEGEVNELREKLETCVQENKKKEETISQQCQLIDELVSNMSSQPKQKDELEASPQVRQKSQEQGKQAASMSSGSHTPQEDLTAQSESQGGNLSTLSTSRDNKSSEKHQGLSKLIAFDRQNIDPSKVTDGEDTSLKKEKALHNSTAEHTKQSSEHLPKPVTPTQPRDYSKQARKGTPSSAEAQNQNRPEEHSEATSTTGQPMKHKQEAITRKEVATANSTSIVTETHQQGANTTKEDDASKQKPLFGGFFSFFSKKDKNEPKQSPTPKAAAPVTTVDLQPPSTTNTPKTKETTSTGKADKARKQATDSSKTKDLTERTRQQTSSPFQYGSGQRSASETVSSNAMKQQQEHQRREQLAVRRTEDSSGRALRTLNDTYRIGLATTEELERQEDTLDRVEGHLDHMTVQLDKGAQNVREIEKPFGWLSEKKESPKPASSNATKQQQKLQRREQLAVKRMEDSSGRALRTLNDTYRIGVATTEELERQEDVLDRVESHLDHMEDRLHTGAENIKELESDSPFSWFSKKKKASKESPKPKPPEMPKPSRIDPSAHATFSSSQLHQTEYPSTGSTVVDRNLEEMSRQLEGLKAMGEHIGEQLDYSDAQLDRVKDKTERTGSAFDTLKKDIAKQL